MAKRVLPDYYTFSPSTNTITIPNRIIPKNQLLLVVNVSSNTVLYNFSDPDLTLASYVCPYSSTGTQFTLSFNTTAMNAADSIMIMEDEESTKIDFSEVVQDPTNKLRVAAPQSLIDTDFEYGTQGIKWESIAMVQNVASYFYKSGANSLNISSITGGNEAGRSLITVNTASPHGVVIGELVTVSNTSSSSSEGTFFVQTVPSTTQFTYIAKGQVTGTISLPNTTVVAATRYDSGNQSSNLNVTTITSDNAAANNAVTTGSVLTITTNGVHGLLRGSPVLIQSGTTTTTNGSWQVYDVPTPYTFRVVTFNTSTGTTTPSGGLGGIYVNPEAIFQHRSSDGGVLVTTNANQEGIAAIRQTRRYFRYQSGKGVQMSSGTKFTPSLDINSITQAGTSVTCSIQQPLTFSTGVTVAISGVETNAGTTNFYNGNFVVQSINSVARTFNYFTTSNTDTSPGGQPFATVLNFSSSVIRVGMFDFQNGFFFEYDGTTLFAVRRDSIKEGMGTIQVTNGQTFVTGTTTKFGKQISPGDYVVIRGSSYMVQTVDSDVGFQISPKYRGPSVTGIRFNITQNFRVPQSQWNMDRFDGAGPSGTLLDLTKMQMIYLDYTWYGAGTIRYGMRDVNGNVVYCHRIVNANRNFAAYMRSGNLPARYEVNNVGPYGRLISGNAATRGVNLASSDGQMVIDNGTYWPDSGQIAIEQGNNLEYMTYSTKTANTSLGATAFTLGSLSRRQLGGSTSNLTFIPHEFNGGSAGASSVPIVTYVGANLAPVVSHWGTSVIMDGGFDDDKSIFFSYPKTRTFNISSNTSVAVLSVRLAPSADNSLTGAFGAREIVNRMQLKLLNIDTNATGPLVISGYLNPSRFAGATVPTLPTDWATTSIQSVIGSNSLAQLIDHATSQTTLVGGEQIFSFYVDSGVINYDLKDVRDLGNSAIGGEGSTYTPGYPNGPDVLTLVATNVSSGTVVLRGMRISWTEAQA